MSEQISDTSHFRKHVRRYVQIYVLKCHCGITRSKVIWLFFDTIANSCQFMFTQMRAHTHTCVCPHAWPMSVHMYLRAEAQGDTISAVRWSTSWKSLISTCMLLVATNRKEVSHHYGEKWPGIAPVSMWITFWMASLYLRDCLFNHLPAMQVSQSWLATNMQQKTQHMWLPWAHWSFALPSCLWQAAFAWRASSFENNM